VLLPKYCCPLRRHHGTLRLVHMLDRVTARRPAGRWQRLSATAGARGPTDASSIWRADSCTVGVSVRIYCRTAAGSIFL